MSDKDNLFKVRREADEDGPIHKSGKSQFCGNCGHVVSDSINSWCEKCRAPLDDDTRIQLLSRDDPVINGKCWQCKGTTSGNMCGVCGSPLTRAGLELNKTFVADIQQESEDSIVVISPKDRDLKKILVSFDEIKETISRYVTIIDSKYDPNSGPQFLVKRPDDSKVAFEKLRNDELIVTNNLKVMVRNEKVAPNVSEIVIRLYYWKQDPIKEQFHIKKIGWNIGLFVATIVTVSIAGWQYIKNVFTVYEFQGNMALDIFLFTFSLMAILSIHELGHYVVSRMKKVEVTLPYFIPVPSFAGFQTLGTFGALIRQKEPIATRDDLFDIGISGPVAGFVVSAIVFIIGLKLTYVVDIPLEYTPQDLTLVPTVLLGDWLINLGFELRIIPSFDPTMQLIVQHPLNFAGYIGFILTGINLIPASQLDGGHTSRSVFGARPHRIVSIVMSLLLIANPSTRIFGFLIFFMGMFQQHPGPVDDVSPVHWSKYVYITMGFVAAIICTPLPINLLMSYLP
ncbi:MAG: site-2 protease family protein [Candidatus Heimdallarchaeota archaeon]